VRRLFNYVILHLKVLSDFLFFVVLIVCTSFLFFMLSVRERCFFTVTTEHQGIKLLDKKKQIFWFCMKKIFVTILDFNSTNISAKIIYGKCVDSSSKFQCSALQQVWGIIQKFPSIPETSQLTVDSNIATCNMVLWMPTRSLQPDSSWNEEAQLTQPGFPMVQNGFVVWVGGHLTLNQQFQSSRPRA
jgi:hypothetical protein